MSTSRRSLRLGLAALAIAAGLAVLASVAWRTVGSHDAAATRGTTSTSTGGTAPVPPSGEPKRPVSSTGRPAAALQVQPPPGVTPAQWQALRAEMAQRPDGAAELARLAAYFSFSDLAQRFRVQRQAGNNPAQLSALAQQLDAALPDRLAQREVSAGEARLLKMAVLETLVADPAERQQQQQRWQARLALDQAQARAADTTLAQASQREQDYLRRQAALVAAWQAQPVAQRDARALEQQIEALRRSSFPPSPR